MCRLLRAVVIAATAVALAVGCRPHKIIPDDKLADIFHDAFLTNAYIMVENTPLDSLKIYEPIFRKYGYTSEDVRYTIGNFSRRKSAKLSNVVDAARARLEEEAAVYDTEVKVLDTITATALRGSERVLRRDSVVHITRAADSTKLLFTFRKLRVGQYKVVYDYENGDDIGRYPRIMRMWVELADSSRRQSQSLALRMVEHVERTFEVDTTARRLVLNLGTQNRMQLSPDPNLTIRNLRITYTPPAAAAIDSLFRREAGGSKIFADEFFPSSHRRALPAARPKTR